jgi:hypothetical protein
MIRKLIKKLKSLLKHVNCNDMRALLILLTFSLCIFAGCKTTSDELPGLLAGVSKVNITPDTPIPMSGYRSRTDPFEGVHDSIFSRAVVFSDGTNKAAIISSEIIGFSDSFWKETSDLIMQETGIPKENILLTAVHNHSGPVTRVYSKDASPEVIAFVEELQQKLVQLTIDASNNLQPARIGAGKGESLMNINRRVNDGKGNIQLGRNPYGPCDHEVGVIRVDDNQGNLLSLMIDWPCHAVVMGPRNLLISGDWPGAASRYIEDSLKKAVAPIIVGASGDINPIYGPHIDFVDVNSYAYAINAIGYDICKEAIRVYNEIKTSDKGEIRALQKTILLPGKSEEESRLHHKNYEPGNDVEVRLSAIKIGDIILAGVNGEVFNQIGVKLWNQSPYPNTFIVTHCNGSSGYLVSDDAIPEGGYEVRSTSVASGAEEGIISGLLGMIQELGE